jgi:hypothetical protein
MNQQSHTLNIIQEEKFFNITQYVLLISPALRDTQASPAHELQNVILYLISLNSESIGSQNSKLLLPQNETHDSEKHSDTKLELHSSIKKITVVTIN